MLLHFGNMDTVAVMRKQIHPISLCSLPQHLAAMTLNIFSV